MVRKNTMHKKTEQGTHPTNPTIRTNTRLLKMRQQISPGTSKHLPSKKRGMQDMQEDRPLCQTMKIRKAPTTTIQYSTKTTTKLPGTTTTEEQPTGYNTNTTKVEEHKRKRNRRHTGHN